MESDRQPTPSPAVGKGFLLARALSFGALSLLAACQAGPPAGQPSGLPTPARTTDTTPAANSSPSPFPRRLTDDEDTEVTVEAPPERVISLTPATTELMFGLDAGDRLVGGTDFDDYPPQAADLPDVATFTGVLIERVVELEPDLVLAGGNNFTPAGDIERLRELGMPVVVLYASSVDGVLADIRLVGQATGADQRAEAIVSAIEARIDEVTGAVAGLDRPGVFYEIGYGPEIYGPAPESFVADMVATAGGEPVTTGDPTVFAISLERLVAADPEVIVVGDAAYGVCPPDVAARAGWQGIAAVSDGAVRPVDDIIVTRPGPRLGEGLAALALAIHPEAAIDVPEAGATYCAES
jgi:iron complex transport system substrate-binding protein